MCKRMGSQCTNGKQKQKRTKWVYHLWNQISRVQFTGGSFFSMSFDKSLKNIKISSSGRYGVDEGRRVFGRSLFLQILYVYVPPSVFNRLEGIRRNTPPHIGRRKELCQTIGFLLTLSVANWSFTRNGEFQKNHFLPAKRDNWKFPNTHFYTRVDKKQGVRNTANTE